jgi:hypothetical protein
MWTLTRQAMLRAEYRDWYPWLTPGAWYRAGWLAEIVRRQREAVGPRWAPEPRIPCDEHFVFRGGPRMRTTARPSRGCDASGDGVALRLPRLSLH